MRYFGNSQTQEHTDTSKNILPFGMAFVLLATQHNDMLDSFIRNNINFHLVHLLLK